jgi:hypothetical protein
MNPFNLFRRKTEPLGVICPNCHHEDWRNRNLARRVGGTVGAVAGAASGVSGILAAARVGMIVGAVAGPAGSVMTAIAAATLRGIVGGTIGCEVGTALGGLIDKHVLENDCCRNCGYPHGPAHAPRMSYQQQPWPGTTAFPTGPGDDDSDRDDESPDGMPLLT